MTFELVVSLSTVKYPILSNWNLSRTLAPLTEISTKASEMASKESCKIQQQKENLTRKCNTKQNKCKRA